jgi:hypothetical protein
VFYNDTGTLENIRIANNTLARGWFGIALVADGPNESWTKNNIVIVDNKLDIQNRNAGDNWGIAIYGATSSNVTIAGNYISFDPTGHGALQFLTIGGFGLVDAMISRNTADEASAGSATVRGQDIGIRVALCTNRTKTGAPMTSLPDNCAEDEGEAVNEVWIAKRTDGRPGTGAMADPFDGSTQVKFDTVMAWIPAYTRIHLGPGTFRTAATHSWLVKPGWVVEGAGMDTTTIQVAGPISGVTKISCFSSPSYSSTDRVILRRFTVDCNWAELSATATPGAGGVANASVGAVYIFGSNNLVEDVKSINTYGSLANLNESFAIGLAASVAASAATGNMTGLAAPAAANAASGNIIRFCHAESPKGDYSAPFALHGCTNSSAYGNQAIGRNDGVTDGFNAGGVSGIGLTNCQIYNNTFTDCAGAFYSDTGSFDNVKVFNNTVVRGWLGVTFASDLSKSNIEITNNSFVVQNRMGVDVPNVPLNPPTILQIRRDLAGNGGYGIVLENGSTTNLTIANNTITSDTSGSGASPLWGIAASPVAGGIIANNAIEPSNNSVSGTGVIFFNNRRPDGSPAPGL